MKLPDGCSSTHGSRQGRACYLRSEDADVDLRKGVPASAHVSHTRHTHDLITNPQVTVPGRQASGDAHGRQAGRSRLNACARELIGCVNASATIAVRVWLDRSVFGLVGHKGAFEHSGGWTVKRKTANGAVSRRQVAKGAIWSVPVIAVGAAAPAQAASGCTETPVTPNLGTWLVNGPKSSAAGYFGTQPINGLPRFYYQPSSVLQFTWVWTIPAGDPVPAGTQLFVGLGGVDTTSAFWINSVTVPTAAGSGSSSIQYTSSTAGGTTYGPGSYFAVTAAIPAGSVVTFSGTVTLRSDVPQQSTTPQAFTAYATAFYTGDPAPCPPIGSGRSTGYEQTASATTAPACDYAIVSQDQLDGGVGA